ncbi:Acetyl esterase/lipase [Microbacterium sp. cf046]|uniref:alpha/beta hydrolase fold domain-containing protein n=1 Tax=Microbacterium sp. cf046 TaxID=1761803 RepID=UPI0008E272EE|nr:alpha/beta hydrolase fold domain-containing protein [Microbacterium sp. cf046]SFS13617.1 Acetyl esterase/lipase [Microbacterium sp. cf046]
MTEPYAAAGGLVRVYPPTTPPGMIPNGAGLVWAHGGGFAGGDLDMPEADGVARALAARGVTVVSVDYALAPTPPEWAESLGVPAKDGVHYPAASDEVIGAFRWALDSELSPGPWALGGASAGANLAAGAALRMLADGGLTPALIVLAYPTLLAVQPEPDAALRAALDADPEADTFGPDAVRGMYENYLGGPVDDAPLPAIPGLATAADLALFPPTLMINGDADELRVSGEHFARTLAAAGRDIVAVTEPGTRHGHLNRPEEPACAASLDRIAARIAALPPDSNPRIAARLKMSGAPEAVDSNADASAHAPNLPTEGSL